LLAAGIFASALRAVLTIGALNYSDEVNRRDEPDCAKPVPQLFGAAMA
jgi:hypothetical protein